MRRTASGGSHHIASHLTAPHLVALHLVSCENGVVARSQVTNSEDDEKLPYFRYVTSYVMGGEVQQKTDPDSMVSALLAVF